MELKHEKEKQEKLQKKGKYLGISIPGSDSNQPHE